MNDQINLPDAAPEKPPRWRKVLLFVSLAFNLLVVGLVVGAILSGPRDRDRSSGPRDLGFGPFVSALPQEDQGALRISMRDEARQFRENRGRFREQFERIVTALRADPYDAQAVERLVSEQDDWISERQAIGKRLLLERIANMSTEQRSAYADALTKALKRGGRSHKH